MANDPLLQIPKSNLSGSWSMEQLFPEIAVGGGSPLAFPNNIRSTRDKIHILIYQVSNSNLLNINVDGFSGDFYNAPAIYTFVQNLGTANGFYKFIIGSQATALLWPDLNLAGDVELVEAPVVHAYSPGYTVVGGDGNVEAWLARLSY